MSQSKQAPTGAPTRDLAAIRAAGKQVAKDAGGDLVKGFFDAHKDAIAAVLPRHMTPERMLNLGLRALRVTPRLMECSLSSLFGATVTVAQMGLEPNTPLRHVHLIPYRNSKANRTDVQVIIGYQGYIELARRSGEIETIVARAVYANDKFRISYGIDETIEHEPALSGERGEFIGAYAVAKMKGGGHQFEWMARAEIDRIRDASSNVKEAIRAAEKYRRAPQGPWFEHYDEMARKTVIRRLSKYLPLSVELASAIEMDEKSERGAPVNFAKVLDNVDYAEVVAEDEGARDEDGSAADTAASSGPSAQQGSPDAAPVLPLRGTSRAAEKFSSRIDLTHEYRMTVHSLLSDERRFLVKMLVMPNGAKPFCFLDHREDVHAYLEESEAKAAAERIRAEDDFPGG